MKPSQCFTSFVILCCCISSFGREYNHKQNTDFLAHEAGAETSAWPKRDYVASDTQNTQRKQDYDSQFPALGSPTASQPSTGTVRSSTPRTQSGLRDYVAPQLPSQRHKSTHNGNVTPQVPNQNPLNINNAQTGKRDYVAPQTTTHRTLQGSTGKVKDLVNFFDGNSKDKNRPQSVPSFSSILQGNKQTSTVPNSGLTQNVPQTTPKIVVNQSTMPSSYSTIVTGNKVISTTTVTTPLPSTRNTPSRQNSQGSVTLRPGSPVLPSSIVNNNKNIIQGNNNNNGPTDAEIQILSEELLRKDTNNAAKYVTINYQQKTTSQTKEDKAPLPLLTIAPEAWNIPTVQKLVPLLDNYERDTMINEHVTAQERGEENAFMDVLMNTAVIRHLMTFLKDKGYISPDPKQQRDFLKQLWFNLYSRGKGKISSSGFEHVFVSELKNGDVQGLHNWIYFSREEAANRANYLGYLKYQQLGEKGAVLKLHFNQQGLDKPVDTMFIGTSPELEIALYTLCFVTRADNDCQLKLASKDVNIVTHTFRYRSKNYIGSAYPQI